MSFGNYVVSGPITAKGVYVAIRKVRKFRRCMSVSRGASEKVLPRVGHVSVSVKTENYK